MRLKLKLLLAFVVLLPTLSPAQIMPPDLRIPGLLEDEVAAPGETWSDGVPTRMKVGRSSWSSDQIFKHFFRIFENAGYYIAPQNQQLRVGHSMQLTAAEVGSSVTFTVLLTPARDGTTNVVVGQADFSRMKKPDQLEDPIPLPGLARNPIRTRTEGNWSVVFEVSGPEDAVFNHYDQVLSQRGFVKKQVGVYEKAREQVQVTLSKGGDGVQRAVVTSLSAPQPSHQ